MRASVARSFVLFDGDLQSLRTCVMFLIRALLKNRGAQFPLISRGKVSWAWLESFVGGVKQPAGVWGAMPKIIAEHFSESYVRESILLDLSQ